MQNSGSNANYGSQGAPAAPPAAGAPKEHRQQQQHQEMFGLAHAQPARRWVKYYIQRAKTNASHALFYVVDEAGLAKLAVVGTDVKLSGHFVYASVSDMTEAPALRCTNRAKVLDWLAALGAVELAEDHEVTLPQLAPHHWQQLHSNNPMTMRPKLDRNYTSWKEDTGSLPDGRHYKHFHLVDASTGYERLAVVGEDSARQDRRYTYKALDDVGGFCFENGKAVADWLDFVTGRSAGGPSNQMRRERPPPERKNKGSGGDKKKGGAGGATSDREGIGYEELLQQGTGSRLVGHPLNPARQPPPMRFGSDTLLPPGPGQMYAAAQHGVPLPFDQQQQQQYGSMLPQPHHQQQQMGRFGSLQAPLGPLPGGPGYQQHPHHPGPPGGPPAMQDAPVDMAAAVRAAGEEVRQLFGVGGQPLLTFVTHVPDSGSVDIVTEMARRLSSLVDVLGLTGSPGVFDVSSEVEAAVSILQFLSDRPASLKLLEQTGIGRTVSLLGCMHDTLAAQGQELRPAVAQELRPVQELALQLAVMWHYMAALAHKLAAEALEGGGGGGLL